MELDTRPTKLQSTDDRRDGAARSKGGESHKGSRQDLLSKVSDGTTAHKIERPANLFGSRRANLAFCTFPFRVAARMNLGLVSEFPEAQNSQAYRDCIPATKPSRGSAELAAWPKARS